MAPLSFILIPLMAPGHIIPMIDMGKLLSGRGVRVSIIVTPQNASRYELTVSRAVNSGHSIELLPVKFPGEEIGLPPGCENIDALPSYTLLKKFFSALILMQGPVEKLVTEMGTRPNCIISDKHIPWVSQMCKKLDIPWILFDGMSCFTGVVDHNLYTSKVHESVPSDEHFVVPGLPDEVKFTRVQLPGLLNPGPDDFMEVRRKIRESESQAYGVVVNTFEAVEKPYVEEFRRLKGGNVWAIGPFSLCGNNKWDRDGDSIAAVECLNWLGRRKEGSVIYACLGSLGRLSPAQFGELASCLESTGRPFIVVVKGGETIGEIEEWIKRNGVEERTKERGLFFRGLAPQVLILSHPAVGGFVTHCGWNSTLEAISAGVPMITWPLFGEQFLNEKLVVEILKIGVRVGAREVVHLIEVEKCGRNVKEEEIRDAIERAFEDGGERRSRALKLKKMAEMAVEGGSSYDNVTMLIKAIEQLMQNKK